jgi:hypothetical protein
MYLGVQMRGKRSTREILTQKYPENISMELSGVDKIIISKWTSKYAVKR